MAKVTKLAPHVTIDVVPWRSSTVATPEFIRTLDLVCSIGDGFKATVKVRLMHAAVRHALRERGAADLDQLATHFLSVFAQRHGKGPLRCSPAALARLHAHAWPGNIRELENCIEGAVVLCQGDVIDPSDLSLPPDGGPAPPTRGKAAGKPAVELGRLTWDEMERLYIEAVLATHAGNRSAAAKAMGIGRTTLLRKIATLKIPG